MLHHVWIASHSNHYRMLQYPSAVTAECYGSPTSVPQQSLQNVTSRLDSILQQSLRNVTASLSSHCRMLQYPSAVTAECYGSPMTIPQQSLQNVTSCLDSIPQQSLQNVTVSLSSHCRMLRVPHDCLPAVTVECYIMSG